MFRLLLLVSSSLLAMSTAKLLQAREHPELTNIAELRDVQATRNCWGADDLQSIRPVARKCSEIFDFEA
jgi:hypothetical protein